MFKAKEVSARAMTECTQDSLEFESHFSRQVVAWFDGGALTSDAGALLLREADRRIRLIERLAACFDEHLDPAGSASGAGDGGAAGLRAGAVRAASASRARRRWRARAR